MRKYLSALVKIVENLVWYVVITEGLEVHAFCGTGDENIMPTCREAGN